MLTNRDYREHEGVSRSDLNVLLTQTPLHFKYKIENRGEEDSKALHEGRIFHKEVLEPETFLEEFAIIPDVDRRTRAGKELYASFLLETETKEPCTLADYEKAVAMKKAIDSNPLAKKFLTGVHEVSYFWTDSFTGEKCKVRPDCIAEVDGKKYIVDYKTTDSCADGHFERSVRQYGYKFQAGMYREGVFQNTFEEYGFAFVAQEKKAPYATRVYVCSEDFIQEGYDLFRKAIGIYHFCKTNDVWPGYEGVESVVSTLEGEGDI